MFLEAEGARQVVKLNRSIFDLSLECLWYSPKGRGGEEEDRPVRTKDGGEVEDDRNKSRICSIVDYHSDFRSDGCFSERGEYVVRTPGRDEDNICYHYE